MVLVLGNFLIGLREGLEAALVVSILVAYLVKSDRRHLLPRIWLGVGLVVALCTAITVGLGLQSRQLTFQTQELVGGALSIVAAAFVTWMIFWMATAARSIAATLRGRVDAAAGGSGWALVLVAVLAVGREGLETTLILYSNTRQATGGAAGEQTATPILAALLGIAVAVALTTQCQYCLAIHTDMAKKAGATTEELAEASFVAAALRAGAGPDAPEAVAQVLKTWQTQHGGKLSLARIWSGTVKEGDTLSGERVGSLSRTVGMTTTRADSVTAGQIAVFGRMEAVATGDVLASGTAPGLRKAPTYPPVFATAITVASRSARKAPGRIALGPPAAQAGLRPAPAPRPPSPAAA